jgi:hypothetical protein
MRSWSARFSLLWRFTVMGVVVVAALGLAIGFVLEDRIEDRALDRTIQDAQVIAQLGVQPSLTRADLRYPISLNRMNELDVEVGKRYFPNTGVLRIKLFNRHHRLVYSDDRTITGRYAVHGANVGHALAGAEISKFETGVRHDGTGPRTLEVYVPVRIQGADEPEAVLEL